MKEAVALMQDYDRHSNTSRRPSRARRCSSTTATGSGRAAVSREENHHRDDGYRERGGVLSPGADRAHSRIRSTRVTEIADAGTPQEKAKPAGEENGFMWNLNTYWRFLERDGGTYIQCESLTLSRDVPFALAWIIRPIVTQMPKESLTFTHGKGARSSGEAH